MSNQHFQRSEHPSAVALLADHWNKVRVPDLLAQAEAAAEAVRAEGRAELAARIAQARTE